MPLRRRRLPGARNCARRGFQTRLLPLRRRRCCQCTGAFGTFGPRTGARVRKSGQAKKCEGSKGGGAVAVVNVAGGRDDVDGEQSDKIWRVDLQDDHESCRPVGLRMTLESFRPVKYGLRILRMTPKILSSRHLVGQPDSMTRSYLVTLTGRPSRSASMLYARAAAASVVWYPRREFHLHRAFHFPQLLSQLTPLN